MVKEPDTCTDSKTIIPISKILNYGDKDPELGTGAGDALHMQV